MMPSVNPTQNQPNEGEEPTALSEDYWNGLISENDAGQFLKLTTRTLQAYRCKGSGPHYIRISARCIRYRRADLQKWIDRRLFQNTSEYQAEV